MRKPAAAIVIAFLFVGAICLTACGSSGSGAAESTGPGGTDTTAGGAETTAAALSLTLEDLAQFDGKDGRPAYVAVDGVVYDVSDSQRWPEGTHTSCNLGAMAGQDLSEVITRAPGNMRSNLERMPVVGTLQ